VNFSDIPIHLVLHLQLPVEEVVVDTITPVVVAAVASLMVRVLM
jgi:hypothetical protein